MNIASYRMYRHNIVPEESTLKRFLKRPETVPLIFFVTSLTLWLAFLSKVYFENRTETEINEVIPALNNYNDILSDGYQETPFQEEVVYEYSISDQEISYPINNEANNNLAKINQLTEQLMAQQLKTEELTRIVEQQKLELGTLINDSIEKASSTDMNYITDLNQLDDNTNRKEMDETVLANTDYYNRVAINPSLNNSNSLQNKINQFMKNSQSAPKDSGADYVKELGHESEVRRNQIRSISLQKGESIWRIAERAYGDGYLYHKIMQANPQINEENARYLRPGTIVRVPI